MTCPTVERLVANALAHLDHDELREALRREGSSQLQIRDELMRVCSISEHHANVIADMTDEVLAALRRELGMVN